MSGFRHDIAGGSGDLIATSVQSPNFVHGSTGWQIAKNGSVEFNSGVFRGTISGGTLIISQGSGATFEQIEINGGTGVTTWSKYQSPTVVIRQILANGTDLIYADPGSGNPQGGLISSVSPVAGTDGFSNSYQAGHFLYETSGNAMAGLMWNTVAGSQPLLALFPDSDFGFTGHSPFILSGDNNKGLTTENQYLSLGPGNPPPATGSNYMIQLIGGSKDGTTVIPHLAIYAGNSYNQVADFNVNGLNVTPADGNTYQAGHIDSVIGPFTINSTSDTTLKGFNVAAGTYKFKAMLRCVAGSGTAQALRVGFTGTATVTGTRTFVKSYFEAANETMSAGNINGFSNYYDTGSVPNSTVFDIEVEGIWVFSASGTFNFVSHVSTAGTDEPFTIQQYSFVSLAPN